jgi:hypothetical protein
MMKIVGLGVLAGISPLVLAGSRFGTVLLTDGISLLVLTGFAIIYMRLSLRNTRVDGAPGLLRIRNFLGVSHTVAPHHLARVVIVRNLVATKGELSSISGGRVFVLDDTGHSVLRWREDAWTLAQMQELADSLGLVVDSLDEPISRLGLIERYPRALRFAETRPALFVTILVGSLVAGAAVVIAFTLNAVR